MSVQVSQTSEKTQKHVPKWKKLLSLKSSCSAVPIEYSQVSTSKSDESIKNLKNKAHINDSFKIIEKKRKKDKNKDKVSKEKEKKKRKDKHKTKKRKVNFEKGDDSDRNED